MRLSKERQNINHMRLEHMERDNKQNQGTRPYLPPFQVCRSPFRVGEFEKEVIFKIE
jgi:hypothetical protein